MNSLLPGIGILIVAAITPGPNNVLAMRAGMRGSADVIRTIAGIIAGSLLLYCLVRLGLGAAFQAYAPLRTAVAIAGSGYLIWLAMSLLRSGAEAQIQGGTVSAISPWAAAAFQLMNPKAWILMGIVSVQQPDHWWQMALVLCLVFAGCLSLWALAGSFLAHLSSHRRVGLVVNALLASSLVVFALTIVMSEAI